MLFKLNFSQVCIATAKSIKVLVVKDIKQRGSDSSSTVTVSTPVLSRYILHDSQVGYAIHGSSRPCSMIFHKKHNLILYDVYDDDLRCNPKYAYQGEQVFLERVKGNDHELYDIVGLASENNQGLRELLVIRLSDSNIMMREQISGNVVTGVPLDNNYVPIVNFTGDQIKVLLIDIHNQSFSNIATYDMDFIESEIVEHIASMIANTPLLTPGWRNGAAKILKSIRGNYKVKVEHNVCIEHTVCETRFVIENPEFRFKGGPEHVFTIAFSISNNKISYRFFIPGRVYWEVVERQLQKRNINNVDKSKAKHKVIDNKKLNVETFSGTRSISDILCCGQEYAIVPNVKATSDINAPLYMVLDKNNTILAQLHNFLICHAYEFVFVMYIESWKERKYTLYAWHVLIYDTKRGKSHRIQISNPAADANTAWWTCHCYILKKCQKIVFITGVLSTIASNIFIIDLVKLRKDVNYIEKLDSAPDITSLIVRNYLIKKEKRWLDLEYQNIAYLVDESSGKIYIKAELKGYKKSTIILSSDLCKDEYIYEELEIYPLTIDNNKWINKPKYIPMYGLKELYNLFETRTLSSDLFVKFSGENVIIDKSYNRRSHINDNIVSNRSNTQFSLAHTKLQKDMIAVYRYDGGYFLSDRQSPRLVGVIVINDLVSVKTLKRSTVKI